MTSEYILKKICVRSVMFYVVYQLVLLCMQVGFDSLFFGRIDYQDRAKRKKEKRLEVIWHGSKSLGSSAQVNIKKYFIFLFKYFMVVVRDPTLTKNKVEFYNIYK